QNLNNMNRVLGTVAITAGVFLAFPALLSIARFLSDVSIFALSADSTGYQAGVRTGRSYLSANVSDRAG
ncbi:MAG: hypothetical protein WBH03_04910, partial [Cyclobacteriaceae bacterium]